MTSYRTEYAKFLAQVRKCNPDAHIICTLGTMGATELYPYLEGAVEDSGHLPWKGVNGVGF